MSTPPRSKIRQVVLSVLPGDGLRALSNAEIYERVADSLGLMPSDLEVIEPDGRSKFEHEVQWALNDLKSAGEATTKRRGYWSRFDQSDESTAVWTPTDLAILPPRAQLALASRCAIRVAPLFAHSWPDADKTFSLAVEHALFIAQDACSAQVFTPADGTKAYAASGGAIDASDASNSTPSASHAAWAAAIAARVAGKYIRGESQISADVLIVIEYALQSAGSSQEWRARTNEAIRFDYLLLLALYGIAPDGTRTGADDLAGDNAPIPHETFGPLWPEGEPEGWPESWREPSLGGTNYELTVSGPDGVDADVVRSRTVKLLRLMDRYVRASGGRGVRLSDDTGVSEQSPCHSPQPVGGGM